MSERLAESRTRYESRRRYATKARLENSIQTDDISEKRARKAIHKQEQQAANHARRVKWGASDKSEEVRDSFQDYINQRPSKSINSESLESPLEANPAGPKVDAEEIYLNELAARAKEVEDFDVTLDESQMNEIEVRAAEQLKKADFVDIIEFAHIAYGNDSRSLLIMAENEIVNRIATSAEAEGWSKEKELNYLQQVSDIVYDSPIEPSGAQEESDNTETNHPNVHNTNQSAETEADDEAENDNDGAPIEVSAINTSSADKVISGDNEDSQALKKLAALQPISLPPSWNLTAAASDRISPTDISLSSRQVHSLASIPLIDTRAKRNSDKVTPVAAIAALQPIATQSEPAPNTAAVANAEPQSSSATELNRFEKLQVRVKTFWQKRWDSFHERFLATPEKKRKTLIATGLGIVAAGAAIIIARKYNVDFTPWDSHANTPLNPGDGLTNGASGSPLEGFDQGSLPETPQVSGDVTTGITTPEISSGGGSLDYFSGSEGTTNFNDAAIGDFNKWANGQKVERGDSVWKLAERYLDQKGISDPSKYQIDAVKDDIVQNWKSQGLVNGDGTLRANPNDILRVR